MFLVVKTIDLNYMIGVNLLPLIQPSIKCFIACTESSLNVRRLVQTFLIKVAQFHGNVGMSRIILDMTLGSVYFKTV